VAAAAFLLGIAFATATTRQLHETTIAHDSIGPSGGTLRFEGGEVVVPPGAVTQQVEFVVRRSTYDDEVTVRGDKPVVFGPGKLFAYRFEPTDIDFIQPVAITFRLPEGARNGTAFYRRGTQITLLSGTIDPNRGTTTTRVRNFRFTGTS
jgi:hypothetical protein